MVNDSILFLSGRQPPRTAPLSHGWGMGTLGTVKVKVLELQNQTQGTDPSVDIIIKTMKSQKKTVDK